MEIRVDKFLALTATLAGFVPVTTRALDLGDGAAREGEGEGEAGAPAGAKIDGASDGGPGTGAVRG